MTINNQIYNFYHYLISQNTSLHKLFSHHLRTATFFCALLLGIPLSGLSQDITFQEGDENSKLTRDPEYPEYKALLPSNLSDNNITILSGSIPGRVFGGYADDDNTLKNSVTILGGTIGILDVWGLDIYGGYAYNGNALNNSIVISDGTIYSSIYGGYSTGIPYICSDLYANNNSITISGGNINGDVYGGYVDVMVPNRISLLLPSKSDTYYAINNAITISGNPTFSANSSIFGGISSSGDDFAGNTLNFSAKPIAVSTIGNFENYNFTIDPTLMNNEALITTDNITLGDGNNNSKIKVNAIHSGRVLDINEKFVLISSNNSISDGGEYISNGSTAQQGVSILYKVRTEKADENTIIAVIESSSINPQLKALLDGRLASAMLVTRGADNVAYNLFDTINQQNAYNGFVPFVDINFNKTYYDSQNDIDANANLLTTGLSYQREHLTAAILFEYGFGYYNSRYTFSNAPDVKGKGDNHYYGVGLLARYNFDNGFYVDGSLRLGRVSHKFKSDDIVNQDGGFVDYDVKNGYTSAHLGSGYLLALNDKTTLDLSAKYLWTRLSDKKVTIAGDPFDFEQINSNRIRLNSDILLHYSRAVDVKMGLGYEYEFTAKERGTIYGNYDIGTASVKGSTGIINFGLNIHPQSLSNLSFNTNIQGYVGKRNGGGFGVTGLYHF